MATNIESAHKLQKPFIDHLRELRKRLLISITSFLLFFIASYLTSPYVIQFLKNSATNYDIELHIFKVTESIGIYMKIMFFQAVGLSVPVAVAYRHLMR
ncbi:twin-arginine translocase subunit TatC [Numidum massiliense]|uniref:twin-arginine translocase subunit TatC n=1 Tax=Numidum massiliense TaxID=1522315 RepID=UPI0006D52B8F